MATIGSLVINLSTNSAAFQAGMKRATASIHAFKSMAISALGGFSIVSVFKQTADRLTDIYDASSRLGESSEVLSKLAFAAKHNDVEFTSLVASLQKMQRVLGDVMGDDGKKAAAALNQLGMSAEELRGLNASSQFVAIADAMSRVADENQKAAIAAAIFGKSWGGLADLLHQNRAAMEDFAAAAVKGNAVVSEENRKKWEDYEAAVKNLSFSLTGLANNLATNVVPEVTKLTQELDQLSRGDMSGQFGVVPGGFLDWLTGNWALKAAFATPPPKGLSPSQPAAFQVPNEIAKSVEHSKEWLRLLGLIGSQLKTGVHDVLKEIAFENLEKGRAILHEQGEELRKLQMGEKAYTAELLRRAALREDEVALYEKQFDMIEALKKKADKAKPFNTQEWNDRIANQRLAAVDAGFLTRGPHTDRSGELTPELRTQKEQVEWLKRIEKKVGIKPNVNMN